MPKLRAHEYFGFDSMSILWWFGDVEHNDDADTQVLYQDGD